MKKVQRTVLKMLLAGSLTQLSAEESVDQQISAIQKAPPSERAQLMNQLKVRLADMNEADRALALNKVRERMQNRAHIKSAVPGLEMQNPMRETNQVQQMNPIQNQTMGQIQNTNMSGGMHGGKR